MPMSILDRSMKSFNAQPEMMIDIPFIMALYNAQ